MTQLSTRSSRSLRAAALALLSLIGLGLSACAPRTAEECEGDLDAMREVVEGAIEDASACERDADCAVIDPSNACEARCAEAVNASEVEAVRQQIVDGALTYCTGFGTDCGFIAVSCEARVPACEAGRCVMVTE